MSLKKKILILRFSSLGDLVQALSLPTKLKELNGELHFVTRLDFAPLFQNHPFIDKLWTLDKSFGFMGLVRLSQILKKEKFTHIYDAHNNLRSRLLCLLLRPPFALSRLFDPPLFLRKSQKRWKRFLLFNFHLNLFEQPFSGQRDLLEPLKWWGLSNELPPSPQLFIPPEVEMKMKALIEAPAVESAEASTTSPFAPSPTSLSSPSLSTSSSFIALAPSAAHPLKRWPLDYWKTLIMKNPQLKFIVLGGPTDFFLKELESENVLNLAGKTSYLESAAIIMMSRLLISNDTGLLHMGEQLGKNCIALMGPAPFGFPSRPSTYILELKLPCRPCSKHGQKACRNSNYHECLKGIFPDLVHQQLQEILNRGF